MSTPPRNLAAAAVFGVALGLLLGAVASAAEVGDVVMKRKSPGVDEVVPSIFPHWIHRMQYKCAACHDELFKMKVGATENITMDEINARKSCGVCHDGQTAFQA